MLMQYKIPQIRLRAHGSKSGSDSCSSNSCSDSSSSVTSSRSSAGRSKFTSSTTTTTSFNATGPCWIGKKPEFSGKPEEDAKSHLLSTRDWMEAHNFPEGE